MTEVGGQLLREPEPFYGMYRKNYRATLLANRKGRVAFYFS